MSTSKKSNIKTKSPPQSKPARAVDPHFEREAAKYENPIPSREMILETLTTHGIPADMATLAAKLHIGETEEEGFIRRLNAMEREGQVMRNRKGDFCLVDKLNLIAGRVQGHPDGFGFLIPDDGSDDLFLGPKQMNKVLDKDRAVVREIGVDRKGRREATIVEVLERGNSRVVGRVFSEHGVYFVVAENKRISQDILIEPGHLGGAVEGQVVSVELVAQPAKNSEPVARVTEVLGNYADPGMEIEIALRKHDLPYEWPDDVLAMEKKLPKKVVAKDIVGREDLRKLPFVTIDGETAKDFDDAVYCERTGKGFRLLVAIADVSHYVRPGDALDREARTRGNSVYFPRRVIPMLPEALSNEMCSLNPHVDRLALVCEMAISANGEIKRYEFMNAVFHSAARLTYTRVAKALYLNEPDHDIESALIGPLTALDAVFQALLTARKKRGAIDFETTETQMIFDEGGKIERIEPTKRNDAHRLIEECMLAANVCAAGYLAEHEHATLYRIHEGPAEEKLTSLRSMLKDFGLTLGGGKKPAPADYADTIVKIRARPDAPLLQTVMLRSMKQAVYSPDNVGHFGLAYDAYTHFTSPIRRYPDLLTHRAIKAVLKSETYDPKVPWDQLGMDCSATERRADEATRDVTAWLKCYYMKDRLGETFTGTISGVTGFGIFITLDDVYVEGLVHISELGQDYFTFDKDKHMIVGERTRKKFQLSDRLSIRVARVDIETAKIDFVLAPMQLKTAIDASAAPSGDVKKVVKKSVVTVTSANPPTTPLEGFGAEVSRFPAPPKVKKSTPKPNTGAPLGQMPKEKKASPKSPPKAPKSKQTAKTATKTTAKKART